MINQQLKPSFKKCKYNVIICKSQINEEPYFHKLKHCVSDKIYARARGLKTVSTRTARTAMYDDNFINDQD